LTKKSIYCKYYGILNKSTDLELYGKLIIFSLNVVTDLRPTIVGTRKTYISVLLNN